MSQKQRSNDNKSAAAKPAGQNQSQAQGQQQLPKPAAGVPRFLILDDHIKFHEWLEVCRRRICVDDKAWWSCLFEAERVVPSLEQEHKEVEIFFAKVSTYADDSDTEEEVSDADLSASEDVPDRTKSSKNRQRRAQASLAETEPSKKPAAKQKKPDSDFKRSYDKTFANSLAKMRFEEGMVFRKQKKAIFMDITLAICEKIINRMKAKSDWVRVSKEYDTVELLNLTEQCHGKYASIPDDFYAARFAVTESIYRLKMRQGQEPDSYAKDVRAAYELKARYAYHGELQTPEIELVHSFINGLTNAHQAYKHHFLDYKNEDRPDTLVQVVADLSKYEAIHGGVGGNDSRSWKSPAQLAIHGNESKTEPKTEKQPRPKTDKGSEKGTGKPSKGPKPDDQCRCCKGFGHWKSQCATFLAQQKEKVVEAPSPKPSEDKTQVHHVRFSGTAVHVAEIPTEEQDGEVFLINHTVDKRRPIGNDPPCTVNLDSGAEASIFCNTDLLTDVKEGEKVTIQTIAGEKSINLWGKFGPIDVMVDPEGNINLLSLHDLENHASKIEYSPGDRYVSMLRESGEVWEFPKPDIGPDGRPNKFYTYTPGEVRMYFSTVAQRESRYTKNEIALAKGAREMKMRLGGASDADLIRFIQNGTAVGCPYTPADIRRATTIYGPDVADLKGKTVDHGPRKPLVVEVDNASEQKRQALYVDIFEIEKQAFILAIMKPLYYRFCAILDNRSTETVKTGLDAILDMIRAKGFVVYRVEIDPERGLIAVKDKLGVPVEVTGAGSHVAIAERSGRVVKDRCRLIIWALPYIMPGRFVRYLVMFVVTRLNLIPRPADGSNLCPRERFTGKKLVYKNDLELGFGDYVEVFYKSDNTMQKRTVSAISMCPVGNDEGSWYFYDLVECTVFQRSQWKSLPIPNTVIEMLNKLAHYDQTMLAKRDYVPMSRVTATVGDIPVERMIVNPRLDIPRYGPDGERLELTIRPRQNAKRKVAPRVVEPNNEPAVQPGPEELAPADGLVEVQVATDDQIGGGDAVLNEGELITTDLFEETEDDEEEVAAGLQFEDGMRRSMRLKEKRDAAELRIDRLSVKESIDKFGDAAHEALIKEFTQMKEMEVFEPIKFENLDADQRKRIIHSSAFLKEKTDENGNVTSVKARWVGSGNEMNRELYGDGSSPTVSTEGVFMQFALSAGSNQKWLTVDIGSAYLHSEMTEFVAVYIAAGLAKYVVAVMPDAGRFVDNKGRLLVRLKKALYGCVQSSRLWFEHMRGVLLSFGFASNEYDPCIFHKGVVGEQCTICLHVDDLFIAADRQEHLDQLIKHLKASFREVKVKDGGVNSYLGMRLRDTDEALEVDMIPYIEECLEWARVEGNAVTPATAELFNVDDGDPVLGKDKQEDFHTGVAKMLYLAKRCRPDILPAVSHLTSRVGKANEKDSSKLQRVFRFLRFTKDRVMRFGKNHPNPKLFGYVDAGFGIHAEGQSRSGLVVTLNGTPVIWKTSKQSLVTKSSTEAELVSLSDGLTDIIWARQLLMSQGYPAMTVEIGEDNQSVLAMLERRKFVGNARTKHINVRFFFAVDRISMKEVSMVYVPTAEMLADFMTKPLAGKQFLYLQDRLLGLTELSTESTYVTVG